MTNDMLDPYQFTTTLATLHKTSQSPEVKFGSKNATYMGHLPQLGGWDWSWEICSTRSRRLALELESQAKGHNAEFDKLTPMLVDKAISRLFRPLRSEGRTVKLSLVHGDLWFATTGIETGMGDSFVFDPCSLYAQNECGFVAKECHTECS